MYPFCRGYHHCAHCRDHNDTRRAFAASVGLTLDTFVCPRPSRAAEAATSPCKHRGALLQKGSCSCGDGNVWECAIIGRQIGKSCGSGKCTQYATA